MRESIKTTAAVSAGIIMGLGVHALGHRVFNDPNALEVCDPNWRIHNGAVDNRVYDMPEAMATIERGRARLVAAIHEARGTNYSVIPRDSMPSAFKVAAELLIDNESGFTNYDTSTAKLDTPHEQFCTGNGGMMVYKTPKYIQAEAALEGAGISTTATSEITDVQH